MLKSVSLAIATVLGATALVPQKDANLPKRVQELEQWKATADARIQALEGLLKTEGKPAASAPADTAERVLTVTITNKRFDPSNARARKYEDNIWWDVEYTATGLQRPARSIKGVLMFCDLFGDPRFQVRVTIDDPIQPGGKLKSEGIGIEYNQFLDQHKWLLSTELSNMTFKFEVETVLYEDGTAERFGS
jgi:hypothetical protein